MHHVTVGSSEEGSRVTPWLKLSEEVKTAANENGLLLFASGAIVLFSMLIIMHVLA